MTSNTKPRPARPKTFCPKCHQRGIVVVKLPNGNSLCFACIRTHQPIAYQNITDWVKDHPPLEPV